MKNTDKDYSYIKVDGEETTLGEGDIGYVFYKEVLVPDLDGVGKTFVVKKYRPSKLELMEHSLEIYKLLRLKGVKRIVETFEKVSNNGIIMSNLNENGRITLAYNNEIVPDVKDEFILKKLDYGGTESFKKMLQSIEDDMDILSDNNVALHLDAFFVSVSTKGDSGVGIEINIADLDCVRVSDNVSREELLRNNLCHLASALNSIINKIFYLTEDQETLKGIINEWALVNFKTDTCL